MGLLRPGLAGLRSGRDEYAPPLPAPITLSTFSTSLMGFHGRLERPPLPEWSRESWLLSVSYPLAWWSSLRRLW